MFHLFHYFLMKLRISVKFDGKSAKVNHVIFSTPIGIPNMKAVAQILFEVSCTQAKNYRSTIFT